MLRLGIKPDAGFFFHVANQGKRSPAVGNLFKGMGMLPGVTDLVLVRSPLLVPRPRRIMPEGLTAPPSSTVGFLELKRPDGSGALNKGQVEFRDMCKRLGVPWAEASSLEQVAAFAREFYGAGFTARVS